MKRDINRQKRVVVSLRKKGYVIDDLQGKSEEYIMELNLPRKLKEDVWAMISGGTMWRYLDDNPAESDITLNNIIVEQSLVDMTFTTPPETPDELKKMNESLRGNSEVHLSRTDLENLVNNYKHKTLSRYMKVLIPLLKGMKYDKDELKSVIKQRLVVNRNSDK